MRKKFGVVVVSGVLLLMGGFSPQATEDVEASQLLSSPSSQEAVFGTFSCWASYTTGIVLHFEGTSGIASEAFELARTEVEMSACAAAATSVVARVQDVGCTVSSPWFSPFGGSGFSFVCRGPRPRVVASITDIGDEVLRVPIGRPDIELR